MPYQYKREPLTQEEANRLANKCETHEDRLVVWTLLDTGLRVSELAKLTRDNLDWQTHRIMVYGKGGPYGQRSKPPTYPQAFGFYLSAFLTPAYSVMLLLDAGAKDALKQQRAKLPLEDRQLLNALWGQRDLEVHKGGAEVITKEKAIPAE